VLPSGRPFFAARRGMPPIEDSSRLRNAPPPHSFVDRTVTAIPHRTREVLMSTNEVHSNDAARNAGVARIDMKLEVVVIPVSDVDRAKAFYERIGWRLNIDRSSGEDFRLVQFTPPGSCCSVHFGRNVTSAAPGSARAFLIVTDIEAARDQLVAAGVEVGEFFHDGPEGRGSGLHPERLSYRSRALFSDPDGNTWHMQEVSIRDPRRG
jgi:catechol 2,3-dioxygenase-like lactoylglutathione lyase family enzyme